MFEYGPFLAEYDPHDGSYVLIDMSYECPVGSVACHDGPGWTLGPITAPFLDSGQARFLVDFLDDLNSTL